MSLPGVIASRIHNRTLDTGPLIHRVEPWSGGPLEAVSGSSSDDLAFACEGAASAQKEWSALPLAARESALAAIADEILRRSEDLGQRLVQEVGKPVSEAKAEVDRTAAIFRYYAGALRSQQGGFFDGPTNTVRAFTRRRPLGVVGLITPWNYPLAIPGWKVAPSLAAGNGVVLKPATAGAGVTAALAECIEGASLPDGLFALVTGRGRTTAGSLIADPHIRGISFTGSSDVGAKVRVACAERGIRVQTELGGWNPVIVLADADLEAAAAAVAYGAFGYAGQKCTATRRAIVDDSVYDVFQSLLIDAVESIAPGDPADPSTVVGPLINAGAAESVRSAIQQAVDAGAETVTGGAGGSGAVVWPTVLANVPSTVELGCSEVFGPVLVMERASDLGSAIAQANATSFGLSAGIHTTSLRSAVQFETEIEAGIVVVNRPTVGVEYHLPFGGAKASGYGWREQGLFALDFYSELQAVYEG